MLEPLEYRRLFHSFTLSHGVLTLITHPDSETIGLRIVGPSYIASIDEEGVAEPFPVSKVKSVIIQALQGDDLITINPDVTVPMTIQAGDGNDTIFAGAGPTRLEGDAGDDVLVDGGGADTFAGGDGNDTADFSANTKGLYIIASDILNSGVIGGNAHSTVQPDIETVLGGSGDDKIVGSESNNVLMGNGGADTLLGSGGDDTLSGGNGRDRLDGDDGADLLVGSGGVHDSVVYGTGDVVGALNLSLNGIADDGAAGEHDNIAGSVENLYGNLLNDTLVGNGKANYLLGSGGDDLLVGGSGNDTLEGGRGHDTLEGQAGNDSFYANDKTAVTISGGSGIDTILTSDPSDAIDSVP